MDCSLSGSYVHGILWARILEWVAIPSPGGLPDPAIEPRSPNLQVDSLPSEPPEKPHIIQKVLVYYLSHIYIYIVVCVCSSQAPDLPPLSCNSFLVIMFVSDICKSVLEVINLYHFKN